MIIAVDAMGGDHGASAVCPGVIEACNRNSDLEIAVSIACFNDARTNGRRAVIAAHGVYGNYHDYPSLPRTAKTVLSSPLDRARTIKRPT